MVGGLSMNVDKLERGEHLNSGTTRCVYHVKDHPELVWKEDLVAGTNKREWELWIASEGYRLLRTRLARVYGLRQDGALIMERCDTFESDKPIAPHDKALRLIIRVCCSLGLRDIWYLNVARTAQGRYVCIDYTNYDTDMLPVQVEGYKE
jgi:hypothetical protein